MQAVMRNGRAPGASRPGLLAKPVQPGLAQPLLTGEQETNRPSPRVTVQPCAGLETRKPLSILPPQGAARHGEGLGLLRTIVCHFTVLVDAQCSRAIESLDTGCSFRVRGLAKPH